MARAQQVVRLRHPNLVRMLPLPGGAGLGPVLGDSQRLADFASRGGAFRRFELEQAVRLLLDVLNGLCALHELHVDGRSFVHGQVSPQHIYVGEHGSARLVPLVSAHLMPGASIESNGYVAPELLVGDPGDVRADLFSVGVMLWETLAGRRLFPDTSLDAVIAATVGGKLPTLAPPREAWAGPLCAIAERAIATNPEQRFSSATELTNAISAAVGKHLASNDSGNWQDEAPTPVLQPGRHLSALRTRTPPATVVDVPPPPAAHVTSSSPPPLPNATAATSASAPVQAAANDVDSTAPTTSDDDGDIGELHLRARRGRGWVIGLVSVPIAVACWLLRAAPSISQAEPLAIELPTFAAAPTPALAAALTTPPAAAPTSSSLREAPAPGSAAPTPALAPRAASPSPSPSPSSAQATTEAPAAQPASVPSGKAPTRRAPRAAKPSARSAADYGI